MSETERLAKALTGIATDARRVTGGAHGHGGRVWLDSTDVDDIEAAVVELRTAAALLTESDKLDSHSHDCADCGQRQELADDSGARCEAWYDRWRDFAAKRAAFLAKLPREGR